MIVVSNEQDGKHQGMKLMWMGGTGVAVRGLERPRRAGTRTRRRRRRGRRRRSNSNNLISLFS
jgi:hypothetical protein